MVLVLSIFTILRLECILQILKTAIEITSNCNSTTQGSLTMHVIFILINKQHTVIQLLVQE